MYQRNPRMVRHAEKGTRAIPWDLDPESLGQKRIETENQGLVTPKQCRHTPNDAGSVDFLGFELLHDLEELIVDVGTVAELHLDLVEVHERIFDTKLPHLGFSLYVVFGSTRILLYCYVDC